VRWVQLEDLLEGYYTIAPTRHNPFRFNHERPNNHFLLSITIIL